MSNPGYVEGLALAQLAPGPLAAQLSIYLARSVVKLCKMTLAKDRLLWAIFFVNGALTAWTESEVVWAFALSGVLSAAIQARGKGTVPSAVLGVSPLPIWLVTGLHGTATFSILAKILWFFAEAGAFVFGSGLAIVPFLYGGVVSDHHLFTVIPAPYFRRYSKNPTIKAFVDGVSAAATGAIAGAAFRARKARLGRRAHGRDRGATLAVIWKTKKAPEPLVILAAGLIGLIVRSLMATRA